MSSIQLFWPQPTSDATQSVLKQALLAFGFDWKEQPTLDVDEAGYPPVYNGQLRDDLGFFGPVGEKWTGMLLPFHQAQAESIAEQLSALQTQPVLVVHGEPPASWGYVFFANGECTDRFASRPARSEKGETQCRGSAAALAAAFGVDEAAVTPYLRQLSLTEECRDKAFSDDDYPLGTDRVRLDFVGRLGITQPVPGTGDGRPVQLRNADHVFQSGASAEEEAFPPEDAVAEPDAETPAPAKPWWKFWA